MAIRHRTTKNTLDVGTADEWNQDHLIHFGAFIDHVDVFLNTNNLNEWDVVQNTSTTNPTISISGGFVMVRLTGDGGAGNFGTIRHKILNVAGDITNHNAQPNLHMALEFPNPTADNATHEMGLMANAGLPFAANQDGAFFRIDNQVLYAVSSDGAGETATPIGSPDQFLILRVIHTATSDLFFIGPSVEPDIIHETNVSSSDLTIKFSCADRAGGNNFLNCQAVSLTCLRQQS